MYTVGLPLCLVAAAPLGSILEGYGIRSETEWAKRWGLRIQYVSSVALLSLATLGAAWSGKPAPMAIASGVTGLFVAVPVVKHFFWHRDLNTIASVALKLSSTAALAVTAYTTTPLFLTLATFHLLPSKLVLSTIFGA